MLKSIYSLFMAFWNNNAIRTKISISVGLFASSILIAIILFTAIKMRSDAMNNAEKLLLAESREYSNQIQLELDKAIFSNRSMCETIGSVKNSTPTHLSREEIQEILHSTLLRFPNFLGTYTVWEPNMFDGKDSSYANTNVHDRTGRFIPYWYRVGNDVKLSPVVNYEDPAQATWYFDPKNSLKETVTDPFSYEGLYMISIINPIVKNGTFYGISGTDMSMSFIQGLLDGFNLYDGEASITILSDGGNIVAASKKPALAGLSIEENLTNIPKTLFSEVKEYIENESDTVRVFVPFRLGESTKTWVAYVQIPKSTLMTGSNIMVGILCFIGLASIALLVYGIYYFSAKLTLPILTIAKMAEDAAAGKVNDQITLENSSDEIDQLHSSFEKIISSQQDITKVCKAISEGDFSTKAVVRSDNDELSIAVNKMIDNLQLAVVEDKKRSWVSEGLTIFADLLRSDSNLGTLSDAIISKLIKYLNANQGGLFLLNNDNPQNPYLELTAWYAYERKKFINKHIEIGEGVVGQCYLEKATTVLTEVPDNYVKITSGVGQATPTFLLIVPLIREEEVLGILEIASFHIMEEYQIQFVEKLAESIGSAIYNIKINQRTKTLLQQAQVQAETMREQEEEMRQNMEELQATQEEMSRKEEEYLEEIKRLREAAK